MTVEELIIYNSSLPANAGWTLLDHLQNIAVNREAVCAIGVDIKDNISADVKSDIISVNIKDAKVTADVDDVTDVSLQEDKIGINI